MSVVSRQPPRWPAMLLLAGLSAVLGGCASPAAPRPPSLHLPEPVRDVSAVRTGDHVDLRFAVPRLTTDGQAITEPILTAALCRQTVPGGACTPVALPADESRLTVPQAGAPATMVVWTDVLPTPLLEGEARPVAYRITLENAAGHSAGPSEAIYVAAGAAPPPVQQFLAEGTRRGVLLHWEADGNAADSTVYLERQQLDPVPPGFSPGPKPAEARHGRKPRAAAPHTRRAAASAGDGTVLLEAQADPAHPAEVMDTSVNEGVLYRYRAFREFTTHVAGRTVALRSDASSPAEVRWQDVYPPPTPTGLTALGYATGAGTEHTPGSSGKAVASPGYAVDLIWQPVNDPRVLGYLVTRQALDATGAASGPEEMLTQAPVTTTGYHDVTADPAKEYRYMVVAIDGKGNRSAPASTTVPAR